MSNELLVFEGKEVQIEVVDDVVMFEIYSVGSALGYSRWTESKGKKYFKIEKSRIDKIAENAEISTLVNNNNRFIDINGVRKLISMSNTKNKGKFIDWLKQNKIIQQEEVFEFIRKEEFFMNSLSRVVAPMGYTLHTQKINGDYRFDGYIPELDMIIEYDENGHMNYNLEKEVLRDEYISNNYSHIIRVTDFKDLMTNIGLVIQKIINIQNIQ